MTFIVVPHGGRDLSTRSFEISYRRLRVVGVLLLVAVVVWLVMAISWAFLFAQAARVQLLQGRIATLEQENARVAQLSEALRRLEARYEQVRQMLGAGRGQAGDVWLPPAGEVGGAPMDADSAKVAPDSVQAALPISWPLDERGFVTRGHHDRLALRHPGVDIAVAEGSAVLAAGAGVVVEAAEDPVYGKFVRIRHRDGYESLYGHASELLVRESDTVGWREPIARSGNTGTSTAPHLHFEIWKDGEPVDPQTLARRSG